MTQAAIKQATAAARSRPLRLVANNGRPSTTPSGKAGAIAWELEKRLMTGGYRFGEEISSMALVDEFAASRQPVSAAISYLRARGYVEVIPQVGCQTVSPSTEEIADMFLGLGRLEGLIASLAAQRQQPGEADMLVHITEQNRFTRMDDPYERQQYIAGIDSFHEHLMLMARSAPVCDASASWNRLSKFYLWQGSPTVQPSVAETLNNERREIARAVAKGDSDRAARIMEAHITQKPYLAGIVDAG